MDKRNFVILSFLLISTSITARTIQSDIIKKIETTLTNTVAKEVSVGKVAIDSFKIEKHSISLFFNDNLSYMPLRNENVKDIYNNVHNALPDSLKHYSLFIYTNNKRIEEYIPAYRPLHGKRKSSNNNKKPIITELSKKSVPAKGLLNKNIALWQSHGYYFEQKLNRWEWQRARIFQTVEDLFPQSFVLQYLVPMLENAGAYVFMPRERDVQSVEIIVDNDQSSNNLSKYVETNGEEEWREGGEKGFALLRKEYKENQNPFTEGTYRVVKTIKKGAANIAQWNLSIPEKGEYAVYISYKSLQNSSEDVLYTVYHQGGASNFKVNQKMGGGTWIYLGTFCFDVNKNSNNRITLSNVSQKSGQLVTADAVKIGGGMGNICRRVSQDELTDNTKSSETSDNTKRHIPATKNGNYQTSGYPRFCEAARYWLQWAGVPDSIYSPSNGSNDYTDDYKCRGKWVNYLCGGTKYNPNEKGLNIPIDMAFAFHTDAGTTLNDSIIGTLGIYCTSGNDSVFNNGESKYASHDLTDLIQSSIVNDIRRVYEPKWTRRGMWNKSYYEAHEPLVPTMLLELLSHQNFADMRYGLDPRFRFTVSRAIYKGIVRFMSIRDRKRYIVQPLPVNNMAIEMNNSNLRLSWLPVIDSLEQSAVPNKYIVYKRIGNGAFDKGTIVNQCGYETKINSGEIYSFKVTAVNEGGESFPSEILSAGKAVKSKGSILIINGFDRVSGPDDFVAAAPADTLLAGFNDDKDHGVPYIKDISYIGKMKEYRRSIPWMDDDAAGFGDSYGNYETEIIAGNTFDYPFIHGQSILKSGFSFVSCSNEVLESMRDRLSSYKALDLILGKQKQSKIGRGGVKALEFKTFTHAMKDIITEYCNQGGNIFISGSYVGSDIWDNPLTPSLEADRKFATDILKYKWRTGQAAVSGNVKSAESPLQINADDIHYSDTLNKDFYIVESPDAIEPATNDAFTIMRYSENNLSAAVGYEGKYKVITTGFPFETITSDKQRDKLMAEILKFFQTK